ncbi:permease-like cell division protein FtsX [Nocardioides sp. TF02-7]|uniref:permease-like cell division protein FtsX n=1 Tax=Nocardioides sp. TF02-7 TaxID=2917724 RepID=UPI001F070295|nr:permease-like cell division protein FtsX [Nocardioides sp. TF02-7]UMG91611.1 permease-like cell division protein FtsX [Nocardioides sp. TF02-7]
MQLRYVFTELRSGLRRNLSMHLAVVLTLFVSLTLAGCGMLLQRQADKTAEALGNELQILVNLCVNDDPSDTGNCEGGAVTDQQSQDIRAAIEASPEVASVEFQSQEEGFAEFQDVPEYEPYFEGPDPVITVDDWPPQYWITLEDPERADGVVSAVTGLEGVSSIKDQRETLEPVFGLINALKYGSWIASALLLLASLLLVANTIRLAALARRREIGIMRLVGASTLYIALPFLLEALVTAVIGVALAAGALAAFTKFAILDGLENAIQFVPWIGWEDFVETLLTGPDVSLPFSGVDVPIPLGLVVLGPALTLIPTLLLTRKYIKV